MKNQDNHYVIPVFSKVNKLKRLLWQIVWTLFCRWTPAPFYFWRTFIVRIFGGIIGKHVHIYPSCKIWAPWLLIMDDFSCLGPGVEVYNPGGCTIGQYAIVSQNAYLCGATHDFDNENFTYVKKKIVIEAHAWICAKAFVLPGVCCGEGAVLGAGAVSSKDLEPWSVYAGNPAKFVKPRNNFKKQ
ncbi:putative colanic acid biosynthesis acetyltransferase [Flavobacterium sp. ZT3R17]|uniref:putative colanic acid biosynthesis acetyltransferase n=1 Tax=Flavobacterium cryoconiti TaxID=3398736 RepID=UPI003A866165